MATPNSNWLYDLRTKYGTDTCEVFLKKLRLVELEKIIVEECTNGRLQKTKHAIEECSNGKKHYLTDKFAKEIERAYAKKDFSGLESQANHRKLSKFAEDINHDQEDIKSTVIRPSQKRQRRASVLSSSEESDCSSDGTNDTESDYYDHKHDDSDLEYKPSRSLKIFKKTRRTRQSTIQKRLSNRIVIEDEVNNTFDNEAKRADNLEVGSELAVPMDVDAVAADNQNKRKEVPSDEEADVQISKKPKLD